MAGRERPEWRPDDLLTRDEAAAYARLSKRTLARAVADGHLAPKGTRGRMVFRRRDLDHWLTLRSVIVIDITKGTVTYTYTAALALVVFVLFVVGCDVGAKSCHRSHHHADRTTTAEVAL